MSLYTPGVSRKQRSVASLDEEEKEKLGVLTSDKENEKLFQILMNYLSLAQFELARTVIHQLFTLSPERVVRVLRSLTMTPVPQKWLFSEQVPTGSHMAWLAYSEYKHLHRSVVKADSLPPETDGRDIWLALQKKYSKTVINPLGFVGHDRFSLAVLEATQLKVFERKEFQPGNPMAYYVEFEVESKEFRTRKSDGDVNTPKWNQNFPVDLYFADSKITFAVIARRRFRPGMEYDDVDTDYEDEVIGVCSLPLHQLRSKQEFHIWVPLQAPDSDLGGMPNPFLAAKRMRGQGLSQVAKPNYGRLRLRFTWLPAQAGLRPGSFPGPLVQAMEADLLVHNVTFNAHKAHYGAGKGDVGTTSTTNPEDKGLYTGVPDDFIVSGDRLATNDPLLTTDSVSVLREYVGWLLKPATEDSPLVEQALENEGPDDFLLLNAKPFFKELREVLWALPTTAHALIAKLRDLERESALARQFTLQSFGPSKFEAVYGQCIVEMLIKNEYSRAVDSTYHLTHDIYVKPSASKITDSVFTALVAYVHSVKREPQEVQDILFNSLRGANRRQRDDYEEFVVDAGVDVNKTVRRKPRRMELHEFSHTHAVRSQQKTLMLQSLIYSALLGTPQDFALRRFCALEDSFMHEQVDIDPNAQQKIPECFLEFEKALNALNNLGKQEITSQELARQQQQAHVSFFANYYTFVRVSNQHVFQYVLKKALGYCKGRNWRDAATMILPFSELRPLLILLAWDEFEDDFFAREDLIVNLWRGRPAFPAGACREPRLIEWCHRLDFFVKLILRVLEVTKTFPNTAAGRQMRNDKAIRLLDTLRLHSIPYAFRDSLPRLSPSVLVQLLAEAPQPLRDQECEHDIHLVRSYYAIRGLMGVMVGDLKDHRVENPAAPHIQMEQKRKEQEEKKKPEDDSDSEDEKYGGASSLNNTDRLTNRSSLSPKEQEVMSKSLSPEKRSVLDSAAAHIMAMRKGEFQITTVEKMFTLLWVQEKDLLTEEQKVAEKVKKLKARQEYLRRKAKEKREMMERGSEDGMMAKADPSVASTADSAKADLRNEADKDRSESPLLIKDINVLHALLIYLKSVIEPLMKQMRARHRRRPTPNDETNMARLDAILLHITESLWRLDVLAQKGIPATLSLLSAPMETISTIFLKAGAHASTRPSAYLGNAVVADKWRDLCALVKDRARRKRRDLVSGVIDFIVNYYKDPRATVEQEDEDADRHFTTVMQGYFFAMDVSIVFNHLLTPRDVQSLVDWACQFLEHTLPQLDNPEIVELYNFYRAYGAHCREHNRSKYELVPAYEWAKMDQVPPSEKRIKQLSRAGIRALPMWVAAYRLSNRAKKRLKGDYLLDGGWLTSTTGTHEDEVPARARPSYSESYREYVDALSMRGISDNMSEAVYAQLVARQGPDADVSRERMGPWEGVEVLHLLVNLARTAQEEYATALADRKEQAIDTFLADSADQDDVDQAIDERLARVSDRMTVLAKSLMPSLAALRHSLRYSPEDTIGFVCKVAREQSKFMPVFERWVQWRTRVWESSLQLLPQDVSGDVSELTDDVREELSRESMDGDEAAFVLLLSRYLENNMSIAEKVVALEVTDSVINSERHARTARHPTSEVVQRLLFAIVDDPDLENETFRAQCTLRLRDIVWAAQMAIKYIDNWTDVDMCLAVCLKCLGNLLPSHPLRPALAFKYSVIIIFQELANNEADAAKARYIERRTAIRGRIPIPERASIDNMFGSWHGLDTECRHNLAFVLTVLLDAELLLAAKKLFQLYEKSKGLNERFAYHIDDKEEEDIISDRIEAAIIAEYLSPDAKGGRASTKRRIQGLRRLNDVPDKKKFRIVQFAVDLIHDAQARFVLIEYIRRFVQLHLDAVEVRKEFETEAKTGIRWDDVALQDKDPTTTDLEEELESAKKQLDALPIVVETPEEKMAKSEAEFRYKAVEQSLHEHRQERREEAMEVMTQTQLDAALARAARRNRVKSVENPIIWTKQQLLWLDVLDVATKMMVLLPPEEQRKAVSLYKDPKAIMTEILSQGRVQLAAKGMQYFRRYSGAEIDYRGHATLPDVKTSDDSDEDDRFNPYRYVLNFAHEVLSLKHANMGRDIGFAIYDMCVQGNEYRTLAEACLDTCNELSEQLAHHPHALFILHLIKSVLTYLKAKVEPKLRGHDEFEDTMDRYVDYCSMVFTEAELKQMDGVTPDASEAPTVPLMYALRRVKFNLNDLREEHRSRALRQRLIAMDKVPLARRVWEECEMRYVDPDSAEMEEARKEFEHDVKKQMSAARRLAEEFDLAPSQKVRRQMGLV